MKLSTDMAAPAYDLTPALAILGIGLLLAAIPLAWVWLRRREQGAHEKLHALTLVTLFLTFDLILLGAVTRLTDSGLGCPDWPGCYGYSSPAAARTEIAAAQSAMPTGPVTHSKAWIEMAHRYMATGVGALVLAIAVASWVLHGRGQGGVPVARVLPALTLAWVCIQGAFGAFTVTMKLFPAMVALHLLGGLALLALLCAQVSAQRRSLHEEGVVPLSPASHALLAAALVMTLVQAVLGAWVSANYAVLVCNTFPQCQGSLWPAMDFARGFEIWRELGKTSDGENLPFQALTAIHYTHRLFAYLLFIVLAALWWRLRRVSRLRMHARLVAALALLQFATGLSNVVLDWPIFAAALHTGGAAALVGVLTWALCDSRSARDTVSASHLRASELSA